jgi:DNA (cytosine-5)-methyltransferase 1
MRLRLLDLFCGAGGCAVGYHRAGFEVVGVDIVPQPRYPFEFHQGDWWDFLMAHGKEFDVIHASPPCQAYSRLNFVHKREYPRLIEPLRNILGQIGKPYIIENSPDAPLLNPLVLCGTMFGLLTLRHRAFESSPEVWWPPAPCAHWGKSTPKGKISTFANGDFITVTGSNYHVAEARQAMDINWMVGKELSQAIPPAYTEYIGKKMLQEILYENKITL